jgi:hypothetical protein
MIHKLIKFFFMKNKKQTAVEFLEQTFLKRMQEVYFISKYDLKLFEQAKEMEKEQMIDFGFDTYCFISGIMKVPFEQLSENRLNAEHNYKENYDN